MWYVGCPSGGPPVGQKSPGGAQSSGNSRAGGALSCSADLQVGTYSVSPRADLKVSATILAQVRSIVSVTPAGARFLFCFFFPWLAPWATFYRRYAACSGYA
jgi:hypothetical protein